MTKSQEINDLIRSIETLQYYNNVIFNICLNVADTEKYIPAKELAKEIIFIYKKLDAINLDQQKTESRH